MARPSSGAAGSPGGLVTGHELTTAALIRPIVWQRQAGLCALCCEQLGQDWEAHHRRRRNLLGWCPCNIVALHPRCHTQGPTAVHDNPALARGLGLIVPSWGPEPAKVPQGGASCRHWVLLTCSGGAVPGAPLD